MLSPQFPYKGNQLILSSDRVLLHAEKDAIFLFGKEAIGLSSTKTINLDANEKVLIACDKIELGYKAEAEGEPVVLGNQLNEQLILLLQSIEKAGDELQKANTKDLGSTMDAIRSAGYYLSAASGTLMILLDRTKTFGLGGFDSLILSKNTFTK
jgi:hypothetical protein